MGTTHLDALQISGVPTMGVNPLPLANNYWFVSSLVGSNGFAGNSYTQPFATLAYAAAYSGVGVGDCIVVMEGHAETIAAAGGVTLNVVGLYVVGLGNGNYRPTFTFTTSTAATFLISAASTTVANIVGVTGIDVIVSPFSITAAGCTLGSAQYGLVEWQDPSSSFQAIRAVLGGTGADNLIINLKVIGITSGGTAPVNAVRLNGTNSGLINCDFYGRASTAYVEFVTTACTNIEIYGYMYNSGVTTSTKNVVDTIGTSTWFMSVNDGSAGTAVTGGSATGDVAGGIAEAVAVSATAILANGTTIFTISGGPIQILSLVSECVVGGDSAAATVQYSATVTGLSAQTLSAASGSTANAAAHATVTLIGTALSTAAVYNSKGANLGMSPPGGIVIPVGVITTVIGGADTTTGTWRHLLRYKPLVAGARVI